MTDPRQTKCVVNPKQKHRWARAIKDVISKGKFVHILRCRYCARYVGIEFNRVVLPSGRVAITERVFAIEAAPETAKATQELHEDGDVDDALKDIEKSALLALMK